MTAPAFRPPVPGAVTGPGLRVGAFSHSGVLPASAPDGFRLPPSGGFAAPRPAAPRKGANLINGAADV